jgi:hypothetical protein
MTATTEQGVFAACSFCLKPSTQVRRLVAGPGVYICDECVDLCAQLVAIEPPDREAEPEPQPRTAPRDAPPPRVSPWERIDDVEQALELLPRIAAVSGQVEENLTQAVRRARALGATWARIGAALDMTRQSAWERFSGEE